MGRSPVGWVIPRFSDAFPEVFIRFLSVLLNSPVACLRSSFVLFCSSLSFLQFLWVSSWFSYGFLFMCLGFRLVLCSFHVVLLYLLLVSFGVLRFSIHFPIVVLQFSCSLLISRSFPVCFCIVFLQVSSSLLVSYVFPLCFPVDFV